MTARLAPIAALLSLLLALTAGAAATVRDYDPQNPEWNGLSEWAAMAETRGLTIEYGEHVDWGDLDPDKDVLVVLYPRDALDPEQLTTWLRAGGRVLLADDFGKLDAAFEALGLRRRPARGVHPVRWHEDNPALPVATPFDDGHPLARGADELVTNHPAVLSVERGRPDVVFGFGHGEALVVAGSLGPGQFVALADPSVLINGMLAFDGNRAFADEVLAWLAPRDADKGGALVLVTHRFVLTGRPPARYEGDLGLPGANRAADDMNRWMRGLNDWIGDDQALRAMAVLAAFALVLAGMAVLPLARRERLDGSWTRAHGGHQRADVDQLVERYDDPRWDGSYAFPAAVLRDNVEAELRDLIGVREPLLLPGDELAARVAKVAGPAAGAAAADVAARLRSLPTRDQAQALFHARVVSRREFERVYDAAQTLARNLRKAS
jgi:hypothetical protein